jgi:hypothetical protein
MQDNVLTQEPVVPAAPLETKVGAQPIPENLVKPFSSYDQGYKPSLWDTINAATEAGLQEGPGASQAYKSILDGIHAEEANTTPLPVDKLRELYPETDWQHPEPLRAAQLIADRNREIALLNKQVEMYGAGAVSGLLINAVSGAASFAGDPYYMGAALATSITMGVATPLLADTAMGARIGAALSGDSVAGIASRAASRLATGTALNVAQTTPLSFTIEKQSDIAFHRDVTTWERAKESLSSAFVGALFFDALPHAAIDSYRVFKSTPEARVAISESARAIDEGKVPPEPPAPTSQAAAPTQIEMKPGSIGEAPLHDHTPLSTVKPGVSAIDRVVYGDANNLFKAEQDGSSHLARGDGLTYHYSDSPMAVNDVVTNPVRGEEGKIASLHLKSDALLNLDGKPAEDAMAAIRDFFLNDKELLQEFKDSGVTIEQLKEFFNHPDFTLNKAYDLLDVAKSKDPILSSKATELNQRLQTLGYDGLVESVTAPNGDEQHVVKMFPATVDKLTPVKMYNGDVGLSSHQVMPLPDPKIEYKQDITYDPITEKAIADTTLQKFQDNEDYHSINKKLSEEAKKPNPYEKAPPEVTAQLAKAADVLSENKVWDELGQDAVRCLSGVAIGVVVTNE